MALPLAGARGPARRSSVTSGARMRRPGHPVPGAVDQISGLNAQGIPTARGEGTWSRGAGATCARAAASVAPRENTGPRLLGWSL
jgi:hypothetical protein